MAKLFTLSDKERLKSRKDIETLFRSGKAFFIFPYKVIYLFDDRKDDLLQFMVSVPKKQFKKASDRNKVKRATRECWRTQNIRLKEKLNASNKSLQVAFIFMTREILAFNTHSDIINKSILKLEKIAEQDMSQTG